MDFENWSIFDEVKLSLSHGVEIAVEVIQ